MSEIEGIRWRLFRLQREEPLRLATDTSDSSVNFLIEVNVEENTGLGVAVPNSVTGETQRSIGKYLERVRSLLVGETADPSRVHQVLDRVHHPAAACGIDMALYDLLGKEHHEPTFRSIGAVRENIETSVTIDISDPESTLSRARDWVARGFRVLKIKTGLDIDEDIRRLRMVRDELGEKIVLRVDCNQGYSEEEAFCFLKRVEPLGPQFVEQPVSAGDIESLCHIARESSIPVMADESVKTPSDAEKIANEGSVPLVNIKLVKCGGIYPAMEISRICEEGGVGTMVGCMAECQASIAAGLHFALSQSAVRYADLDSFLSFTNDPTVAVECSEGQLSPRDSPGLGVLFME